MAGAVALAFFLGVSWARHRQIRRLTAEIDEVLHGGRSVGFSSCREGDVAILTNELGKMVARLARAGEQLAHEKSALAEPLSDVSLVDICRCRRIHLRVELGGGRLSE